MKFLRFFAWLAFLCAFALETAQFEYLETAMPIHDEDAVTSDRLTIIGFLVAAGLLVGVICFEKTLGQYVSGSTSRFR